MKNRSPHLRLVRAAQQAQSALDATEADAVSPAAPPVEGASPDRASFEPDEHPRDRARAPDGGLGSDVELGPESALGRSDLGLSGVRQLGELPDAQLVGLASRGDRGSFEVLYRRHVSFAIHLATRIEGSARDVEDVVHDAFLKAFERIDSLADPSAFRSWLGSIVVHAVRSRLRRGRLMAVLGLGRSSEPVDLDSIASSQASPQVRAQIAQIYALLRTLSTDDRIAWTLRWVEGHDLETVARLSSCSLATVKRRIARATKYLEEHFVHAEPAPPLRGGSGDERDDAPSSRSFPSAARARNVDETAGAASSPHDPVRKPSERKG